MLNLSKRSALICGASRGIGRATVIQLAKQGARIHVLARSRELLASLLEEIPSDQRGEVLALDVLDIPRLRASVAEVLSNQSIDILVNNTGGPKAGPVAAADPDEFVNAFNQHLIANHVLTQALLPAMQHQGFGRIINVISTSVRCPLKGLGVSNTIRGAVASWAKTLASEVACHGITVNNVLPGATKTERLRSIIETKAQKANASYETIEAQMLKEIPAGRFAEASEIASLIGYLASEEASYITGTSIQVDGGRTPSI